MQRTRRKKTGRSRDHYGILTGGGEGGQTSHRLVAPPVLRSARHAYIGATGVARPAGRGRPGSPPAKLASSNTKGLYFEYSSLSRVCRSVIGIACPAMKTCFTSVFTSSGSPFATTTLAVLPTSREPSWSATPQTSAALRVIALSASSYGSPKAVANPAASGRLRTLCAEYEAKTILTPRL